VFDLAKRVTISQYVLFHPLMSAQNDSEEDRVPETLLHLISSHLKKLIFFECSENEFDPFLQTHEMPGDLGCYKGHATVFPSFKTKHGVSWYRSVSNGSQSERATSQLRDSNLSRDGLV
jgi:hypothetical protein